MELSFGPIPSLLGFPELYFTETCVHENLFKRLEVSCFSLIPNYSKMGKAIDINVNPFNEHFHNVFLKFLLIIIPMMTDVFDTKQFCPKGLAEASKYVLFIFVEIVENWKPLGYYYKCPRQDAFCILIPGLLKFWNFLIQIVKPYFLIYINIWQRSAKG